jgi:glycosyltransferase involved in cell wall biosynthesis
MNTATLQSVATAARADVPRLHVAIVDEELPYPPTSGKRIRTLNLTLRLAQRHRLTYLCHRNSDPDEARRAVEFFADHDIETVVVDRTVPPRSGFNFYARLAANLFSPLPYSVASHAGPQLRSAIADYAADHAVDLWHCEWTPYATSLQELLGARRLIMAHNVESLIWQRYAQTETNPIKRWYIREQWRKYKRFERRATSEVDQTVAVSDADAALLRNEFGAPRVAVVENGVDTTYFQPTATERQANRILFLGSLDWRPNLDAVAQLLEHIFPTVRAAVPTAALEIVGRNPPTWLRTKAAAIPGVQLYADVADVRPHLARCGVMAVPLRIGGGSRLKILEALAGGLPVVSTAIGAEGLHLEPGCHLSVVPGVEEMANALLNAMRHPQDAQELAQRGRERVLERYDWDTLADQLEQIWIQCATSGHAKLGS